MSAYRQILRMGDYQGDVLWEMVISADYSKCFAGEFGSNTMLGPWNTSVGINWI